LRAKGLSLRLFVEIRMDQDQMELELPPELLTACGRHGLGIYVISNDTPVAQAGLNINDWRKTGARRPFQFCAEVTAAPNAGAKYPLVKAGTSPRDLRQNANSVISFEADGYDGAGG
jgi:hypothetical protein